MTVDIAKITEFTFISETLEMMKIKRVPVVKEGVLVAIVSRANIIQALISKGEGDLPKVDASNQEIRSKLLQELDQHGWASTATMNVVVNDGVVLFWGFVESDEAKEALKLAAESISGVKSVKNNSGVSAAPPYYI